jgi:mycothiol system anti-sigma-R factor
MNCTELESCLQPYLDGELDVGETVKASAHVAECLGCRGLVAREREFRQILRRQPRESAPDELRESIRARLGRSVRWAALRPWLAAFAVTAAIAGVVLLSALRPATPLVSELVDTHIAFTQMEGSSEFASADPRAVEAWFRERAKLRVTVADYSVEGIRLVGARVAQAHEHRASYVLYEKGHTPLSVFMVPARVHDSDLRGTRISFRGHDYVTLERKGYRTVSWSDGQAIFGLVSMLDYGALLECADTLRAERARDARL